MATVHKLRHNLWLEKQNFKEKACAVCQTKFSPKSGVHKFCSESCKGKWKYITGVTTTESQYMTISGNWKRYFQRLCCRSHKRTTLSWEDCLVILQEQNYKCALSGIELTCKLEVGTKCLTNASLDRIEAGGPYIKENVQLVCTVLNGFRKDTDVNEFIWWCKKVSEYNA
jgi:hypothetical protein